MGTPDFAVPSLEILISSGWNVVAVITAPDRPAGRGLQLHQTPVKLMAIKHGIPVLQPEKLKNPVFLEELSSYKPDLGIVVAFRMLPELVWNMPRLGTFNLHASLLPQYRGAAPINRAIMNGETRTGVTTFFLKQEIDTGDLAFQEEIAIHPEDNAGTLHDKLMLAGSGLVLKTVQATADGSLKLQSQDQVPMENLKSAPKIFREDCKIDWSMQIKDIHNHVRGLSPYPAAWTSFNGKNLKVFTTEIVPQATDENQSFLGKQESGFTLRITELQLEGKKRMGIDEFLRGNRFSHITLADHGFITQS